MSVITKDLGAVTAYAAAVNRGYTGTKEEFETLMASYATVAQQAQASATSAGQSATDASQSATDAETAKGTAQQAATDAQTAQASAQESAQSAQQSAQSASQSATDAESAKNTAVDAVDGFAAGAQQALDSVNSAGNNWKSLAQAQKLDSEAWALGTRDGEDVGSSDPAYHNNAKYYAEHGGASAQTATEAAQTATVKAGEAAQSASAAAESARTLTIDSTLTQAGQAADAKETGDKITSLKEDLSEDINDLKSAFDTIATLGGTSAQLIDSTKYVDGYRWDTTYKADFDAEPIEASGWTLVNQEFFVTPGTTLGININSPSLVILGYRYNTQSGKYLRESFSTGANFDVSDEHYSLTFGANISAFRVYIATNVLNSLSDSLIIAINSEWDGNPNYGQVYGDKINPSVEIPQINALKNEVESDIQDLQKLNLGTLVDGFVNSQYGSFVDALTYKRTGKLPICGKTLIVTVTTSVTNVGMAFYDENKNFISGSGVDFSGYTLGSAITVSIPQTARYVAYCAINAEASNMLILFPNYADAVSQLVESIQSDSTAKANAAIQTISTLSLGTLEDGYINSASGAAMPGSSYKRTSFIHVHADKLKVAITFYVASVGFAFYDSRKKYISGFDYTGYNVGDMKEVDVPDNAYYFRYCAVNANVSLMQVLIPNYANAVSRIDANPCFYDGSSECRTFKKILCIGDSLTAGQFDYKENGITKEFNAPEYSYPSYLKAITGRDTTNAGDAGETTVSWYELHGQEDFSGHDACIIMLGRNDYVSGRETTSEERATAFANIIAKVRADNPQITIFMATLINYYKGSGADTMNADIRAAATANNCYLLDIAAYGRMVLSYDAYSHCTAEGYYTLAEYFFRYISYIMHNNYTAFKTIQFTGTNRAF